MLPLAHFEKRYAITEEGQIINLANNQPLQPTKNPNGYLKVGLATGDGGHVQELLHILVAKHFIPNPYGYSQVNHKNGIKTDCSKDNLEWCTNSYNVKDGYSRGRVSVNKTPKEIAEKVYAFYRFGLNKRDISRYFQLDAGTVLRVS